MCKVLTIKLNYFFFIQKKHNEKSIGNIFACDKTKPCTTRSLSVSQAAKIESVYINQYLPCNFQKLVFIRQLVEWIFVVVGGGGDF